MGELVECHSGFTYADRPVALTWEGRRLEIIAIPARWRSPEARHFRVRTGNEQEFELSYREADNECPEKTSGYKCPEKTSGYKWQITRL